ncbi:uncharacterized protein EV420DRAFT_1583499 [Desarmillaria tabescens]|uniref:Uncharacterized protein n=1 Tax=Armillaria tabescens TaxID=1929756 RepID=A0AA39MML4_ARMTA|nr:uncharacterized protein EV420DRAFT_1583499 [Desarmillaria tabescens]KAK0439488.1 hypothetical protein EV420DRAFT_1583499 [Desarmillaria tabescens]
MNDTTATPNESITFLLLLGHQNNAVTELRRAMSSLCLVEGYLNQGELLFRSLIRSKELRPEIPQIQPQTPFSIPICETNSPPMSPLLLPTRRSSHNLLLEATKPVPPRLPKSVHRSPAKPLEEEDVLSGAEEESSLPIQETKLARPLRRITQRTPPPRISDGLKAELQAAGISIDPAEPAPVGSVPSSSKVKSTVFFVIENGVATKHQLSMPPMRNKDKAKKERNLLQKVVDWVFKCDA